MDMLFIWLCPARVPTGRPQGRQCYAVYRPMRQHLLNQLSTQKRGRTDDY